MKFFATFILQLLFLNQLLLGQIDSFSFNQGSSLNLIGAKAKNENKAIVLYFDLNGCIPCIQMERTTFKNAEVKKFINDNFVITKINGGEGEGITLSKIYSINMYPTFIFLDSAQRYLHTTVGYKNSEEFLIELNKAISKDSSLNFLNSKYISGVRSKDFLYSYTYALSRANKDYYSSMSDYLKLLSKEDLKDTINMTFLYDLAVQQFAPKIKFGGKEFNFLYSERALFYRKFDKDQVDTRIVFIIDNEINEAIEEKDEIRFKNAIKYLKPFDHKGIYELKKSGEVTATITNSELVLSYEMDFYKNIGEIKKYENYLKEYNTAIWNNPKDLYYNAKSINDASDDIIEIKSAIKYIERSIYLKEDYQKVDLYANLLYKGKRYRDSKIQAERAIEIAKVNNNDFSQMTLLLMKIETIINKQKENFK